MTAARLCHSEAVLISDGRVLVLVSVPGVIPAFSLWHYRSKVFVP